MHHHVDDEALPPAEEHDAFDAEEFAERIYVHQILVRRVIEEHESIQRPGLRYAVCAREPEVRASGVKEAFLKQSERIENARRKRHGRSHDDVLQRAELAVEEEVFSHGPRCKAAEGRLVHSDARWLDRQLGRQDLIVP
eukprot:scaffold581_cov263-Pinguiococcus_pyrenoidosus.AAC.16